MVRDTCALLGSVTTTGLVLMDIAHGWIVASAIATFVGSLVGIWAKDNDDNGTVDIFDK